MNDEATSEVITDCIVTDVTSTAEAYSQEEPDSNIEEEVEIPIKRLNIPSLSVDEDARSRDDIESMRVEVDSNEDLSEDVDSVAEYGEEDYQNNEEVPNIQNLVNGIVNEDAEALFKTLSASHRINHRTIDDDNLPATVSLLYGPNNSKVYLIGTAHFSKESCEDVKRMISEAQPDVVMVELCRGRTDLLTNDEETLARLAGDVSFDKIMGQIKQKGLISGIMTFLLLHMSAHITKQLGMAPGGEFRSAYQESRLVPGCKLLLGDRAVEVTLQRAFSTFSVWQKLKFAMCVLKDLGPIKAEDIEKLKQKDMLEQALEEMMGEFPQMTKVFLSERDIYLAHSLQNAAATEIETENGPVPTVVVGVVGLGHAGGIKDHFDREITSEEMNAITVIPIQSRTRRAFKMCLKLSFFLCMGYGLYRFTYWTGLGLYHCFGKISLFGTADASVREL